MTSDKKLRELLVRALIVELDRKRAGQILERWDELVAREQAALQAVTDFEQLCTLVIRANPDPEIESFLQAKKK